MAIRILNNNYGGRVSISSRGLGGRFSYIADPVSSLDADAQAFFSRVTAAGGTLSATEQTAVNTLTVSLKSAGIWTKMKAIYPMVGSSAAACAQNLKSSSFTGSFNGGWTYTSTGVLGNGVNTFMNSNLIPASELSQDDSHLMVYSRSNSLGNAIVDIGCLNTVRFYIITNYNNATYIGFNFNTDIAITTVTDTRGFFLVTRSSGSLATMYKNNSVQGTTTQASTGINALRTVYLGAYNDNGPLNFISNKEYAFSSIGNGLDATQSSNYYTIVQAFQTTLSRQV
jgi:hypothetical protein